MLFLLYLFFFKTLSLTNESTKRDGKQNTLVKLNELTNYNIKADDSTIGPALPLSNDYSNQIFEKINQNIIIDDNYEFDEILNSKFINPSIPENENYLFIIRKELFFNNVQFIFSDSNHKIGAIKIEYTGEIRIQNCVFIGCSSNNDQDGNAIYFSNSAFNGNTTKTALIESSQFIDNYNDQFGAVYLNSQYIDVIIDNCTFLNNSASINGGAINIYNANSISIFQTNFTNNQCNGKGGSIFVGFDQSLIESFVLFDESIASYCNVTDCIFTNNSAGYFGNVIFINDECQSHVYTIENNQFISNDSNSGNNEFVIASKKLNIDIESNQFISDTNESKAINPIVYIDEYNSIIYENLIFKNLENAIIISTDSSNKLIKNCTFIDCDTLKHYVVIINKHILFEDNIIQFESIYSSTAGLLIDISSLPTNSEPIEGNELNIFNSSFIGCSG